MTEQLLAGMSPATIVDLGAIAGLARHAYPKAPMELLDRAEITETGGITGDERALVKQTLLEVGEVTFSDIAIAPGRTHGFGRVFDEGEPVFGRYIHEFFDPAEIAEAVHRQQRGNTSAGNTVV